MAVTSDPNDPRLLLGQAQQTGQHDVYLVLSEDERAKGFVRPLRTAYRHTGVRPQRPTRPLTDEQRERFGSEYVAYEEYPDPGEEGGPTGRFWTREQLESGCGTVTTMGLAIAETYARDPGFYGATYCMGCRQHLPVAEFRWTTDGTVVGS